MKKTYEWRFPLPRTHTGMLLGNGRLGAMIWGGNDVLNITLGRADLWDHRGGKPWTPQMNYAAIRKLLQDGDEKGLRSIFEGDPPPAGQPHRPTVLPIGRVELHLPSGCRLRTGKLHLAQGAATVSLTGPDGTMHEISLTMSMKQPVILAELPPGLDVQARRTPAWQHVGDKLKAISFEPPEPFEEPALAGWVQALPLDGAVCVAYRRDGERLYLTAERGETAPAAKQNAAGVLDAAAAKGPEACQKAVRSWWRRYWRRVPSVELPNDRLEFIYYYGMYKFAGLTNPAGVPATLQGPWIEEYQLPPWSSDYHFNINVQMCYWPGYGSGLLEHVRPMLDLVWSWREQLRQNARNFVGIDDGFMLPHAVDDRCTCMGGFWTGTVDHGCTAWVGKMMYDYWLYGGDEEFLREVAYPFMVGAMRVYEEMLERVPGGGFRLPVSVSPEYRGAQMNAWGVNASFQLASVHWLLEALQAAAGVLGERPPGIWADIQRGLPRACVEPASKTKTGRIMLWSGTDLEYSHRHHSHWAGLYPFDILEPTDPTWREIIRNTYLHWRSRGMGQWTGWCVPWAAMIETRAGSREVAEILLEYWQRLFTNEGHGTLHDPRVFPRNLEAVKPVIGGFGRGEIMQMDAGMSATAAVMDLLVHVRRGVCYVFPGAPVTWPEASFRGLRIPGGFAISAERQDGEVTTVRVEALRPGRLRLANPWPGREAVAAVAGARHVLAGEILDVDLPASGGAVLQAKAL